MVTTMSEMVERVAMAIERTHHDDDASFEEAWADHDVVRHNRLLEARAAIAAMREPTEAMITEAMIVADVWDDPDMVVAFAWRAMIDEALKESDK